MCEVSYLEKRMKDEKRNWIKISRSSNLKRKKNKQTFSSDPCTAASLTRIFFQNWNKIFNNLHVLSATMWSSSPVEVTGFLTVKLGFRSLIIADAGAFFFWRMSNLAILMEDTSSNSSISYLNRRMSFRMPSFLGCPSGLFKELGIQKAGCFPKNYSLNKEHPINSHVPVEICTLDLCIILDRQDSHRMGSIHITEQLMTEMLSTVIAARFCAAVIGNLGKERFSHRKNIEKTVGYQLQK